MTAQVSDTLLHDGKKLSLFNNPLDDYFTMAGIDLKFMGSTTAEWRGYVATWDIVNGRLYMVALRGVSGRQMRAMNFVFPEFSDRVFAHWYSGVLRVPLGRRLRYVHQGYLSLYERDLLIDIDRGGVTRSQIRHNGCVFPKVEAEGETEAEDDGATISPIRSLADSLASGTL